MENIKTIAKVSFQDIAIVAVFLLLSCGIEKSGTVIGETTAFILFLVTWPVAFILFFYSNAELFKWVKNSYLWSLSTGVPSILLVTGIVIYATHNLCKFPFIEQ